MDAQDGDESELHVEETWHDVMGMTSQERASLGWVRIEGFDWKMVERQCVPLGGTRCTNKRCRSVRFCPKEQTQTGRTRCCGGDRGRLVNPPEPTSNTLPPSIQLAQSIEELNRQRDVLEKHEADEVMRMKQKYGMKVEIRQSWGEWLWDTKERFWGRAGATKGVNIVINEAPVRDTIDDPPPPPVHEMRPPPTYTPPSSHPLPPPPVNDGGDVPEWQPDTLLMENGKLILNDTKRKMKILHMSFIAPTGIYMVIYCMFFYFSC